MKQLYAKIFACGAISGKNFGLRRYFWQKFWPAALCLTKILACGAIFDKNFGLRRHFWQKIFDRYESAFFENLLQEGYVQFLVCCAKLKRKK